VEIKVEDQRKREKNFPERFMGKKENHQKGLEGKNRMLFEKG